MKKILLSGILTLAAVCTCAASSYDDAPVIDGATVTRVTSVSQLASGDHYLIRFHNSLWDSDPYLTLKSDNNTIAKTWSDIEDKSVAIFTLQALSGNAYTTPAHTNITFVESGTSCFAFHQNGNYINTAAFSTSTSVPSSGSSLYSLKFNRLTTIPASNPSSTTQVAEETDEDGFFMMCCNTGQWVHGYRTGNTDAFDYGFGSFSQSRVYYNDTWVSNGVGTANNGYAAKRLSPFFILYKVEFTDQHLESHSLYESTIDFYNASKASLTIGNELGQCSSFTGWDAVETAYTAFENGWALNAATFTSSAFATLCNNLKNAIHNVTYDITPVERGHYLRIEGWNNGNGGLFLGMPAGATIANFNTDPVNTIYYYSPEGHLINFQQGRAIKSSANNHLNTPLTNAEHVTMTEAPVITFDAAFPIVAGNVIGRYYVHFPSTTNTYGVLHCSDGATTGTVGNGAATNYATMKTLNEPRWSFAVSYVDKLPVEIHSGDKCGTVYLPVEVTVPSTHTVYTATEQEVNNEVVLKLTEKTDRVIPAYTHAIITGNAGTIEVDINYAATAAAATASEHLHGNHVTLPIDETDELVPMVKDSSATTEDVALTDGDEIPAANFVRATEIPANAMVLKVAPGAVIDNEPFSVPLSETSSAYLTKSGTTGISKVMVEGANGSVRIFDLSGRELSAPAKGINIIGGKKVLVK